VLYKFNEDLHDFQSFGAKRMSAAWQHVFQCVVTCFQALDNMFSIACKHVGGLVVSCPIDVLTLNIRFLYKKLTQGGMPHSVCLPAKGQSQRLTRRCQSVVPGEMISGDGSYVF